MPIVTVSVLLLIGCFRTVKPAHDVVALPHVGEDFPHGGFELVLQQYVNDDGLVDYAGLRDDRADLDSYTSLLAACSPDSHPELFGTPNDELAYWLNAYNALAVTGVIDRPGLTAVNDNLAGFFYLTRYRLGGDRVSLYKLENHIIRGRYGDPRIHWALNCQSAGCPVFDNEVFVADILDAQLDAAARAFVTDPANVRVEHGKVKISQIFEWYAEDFEAAGGPVAYINSAGGEVRTDLEVEVIPYDWTLLAQPGRAP